MVVGQQCTSMGSVRFKKLVSAYKGTTMQSYLRDAVQEVCLTQCKRGADILDINLDSDSVDGLTPPTPGRQVMGDFLRLCAAEPGVAKVPFMICSSQWDVIEEGLKCVQGKCVVNGICPMVGEEEFLRLAKVCMKYGAAVVVLAVGEKGLCEMYEDKVRVCKESYRLLRSRLDFPPEDIIFDCMVTPLQFQEQSPSSVNCINAVGEIKRTCPSVSIIGGVSNLSVPFRGLNRIRDTLHSVFLQHAVPKGLSLAFAEAGALPRYNDLDREARTVCEEVLLNRSSDGNHVKRFLAYVGFGTDSLFCMPVTRSLPGPRGTDPDAWWEDPGRLRAAKDAQQETFQKRKSTRAGEQKEFLRSLTCNIFCTADPRPSEPDAGLPDVCRISGFVSPEQLASKVMAKGNARLSDLARHLNGELRRRVLLMSSSIGARLQAEKLVEADYRGEVFRDSKAVLHGNHDLLVITRPDLVTSIHKEYLIAGCDIIGTNTMNATSISQLDYGVEGIAAYDLNKTAAQLAKSAAAEVTKQEPAKPRFVAGIIGPTSCSLRRCLSSKWNDVVGAYTEQIRGLVDGGVDILSIEMVADTLNAKAAIYAVDEYFFQTQKERLPLMMSVTVSGDDIRTLSQQTPDAFAVSVKHAKPMAMGMQYALGTKHVKEAQQALVGVSMSWSYATCDVGTHDPEAFASSVFDLAKEGLVNIVGSSHGSLPSHISAAASKLQGSTPRPLPSLPRNPPMQLSGLEMHSVRTDDGGLQMVGQRCNMTGSNLFKGLVEAYKGTKKGNKWEAVMDLCARQCEDGADIIDFNFDSNMIDVKDAMGTFMRLSAAEPSVAKVPFVISSVSWPVIEEALQSVQGKCIVNAISVIQGEEEFLRLAKACQRYGAAIIVMAIEKDYEFATYQDKVSICQRCYNLLRTKLDFPAEDIIFDCTVMQVDGPDNPSHLKDTIDAVATLKRTCPSVSFIGGVGNMSAAYRKIGGLREALHSVFIYNAVPKGLNMAFVEPGAVPRYSDIEESTRRLCEEVLLNDSPDGGHLQRFQRCVAQLSGASSQALADYDYMPVASEILEHSATMEPPGASPQFRAPFDTIVQATGAVNASVFQMFGGKSHPAKNFHRFSLALGTKRNITYSSISVWMGQGGSGPIPGSSALMDGIALWERWQMQMPNSATIQWGAVGEIGQRVALYGSRDVMEHFDLGQKLLKSAEAQFLIRRMVCGEDIYEYVAFAYLDQTWQATLTGAQKGGGLSRSTFADI